MTQMQRLNEMPDTHNRTLYDLALDAMSGKTDVGWGDVYAHLSRLQDMNRKKLGIGLNDGLWKECEQAKFTDEYGCTVLHKVISCPKVTYQFIYALICAFPGAVVLPDHFGRLPLHHAIGRAQRPNVEGIEASINGASDDLPKLPRHLITRHILESIGNPLLFTDSYGDNVLHLMLRNKASSVMIKTYLNFAPEAMNSRTHHLDTPLHTALRADVSYEIIKLLVDASPSKHLTSQDSMGNTPMHCSIIHGSSNAVMKLLVLVCPRAMYIKNEEGRFPQRMFVEYGYT